VRTSRTLVPLYPCAVSLSLTASLSLSLSRSLSVCIYIYMYIYICIYIYTHIYIYIYIYVLHVYITRLERHPMHWVGSCRDCQDCAGGRCLAGLCMCLARSLSLPSTDNAPYRSPLAISLDLSRCIYTYTYIYICISSSVNAPHRSPPHISLSRCIYIYSYIYIYICIYMYILQALTVHHTPLPCLSLQASGAYQNSELA